MQANSNDDNGHDKGSSTNLSSVVDSQPLKAKSSVLKKSPLRSRVQIDQENTELEKIETPEMSRPMEMALVSVLNPLPQSSIILGVTIFDQPPISPEVIETATQSIDDVQIPSMPIDDSTSEVPVQEEAFQEGNETPFDFQGQNVSMPQRQRNR